MPGPITCGIPTPFWRNWPCQPEGRHHPDCLHRDSGDADEVACALESHFLQSQSYPANLEELKAEGYEVPLDPLNRQPLRYQKLENGQYRLWTAGVDRKDDEGKRVLDAKNPESTKYSDEKYQGDWVWERGGK
ncbi:hypothetical protein [Verrucomicrobium spinosum]|uniref:hypothetical protein n=1 Tax=Verrucomicrobium spinosum TaxID=2736 RepID=UPI0012E31AD4|nr:hypothetical protein [Verrucomicrobium spinosum]